MSLRRPAQVARTGALLGALLLAAPLGLVALAGPPAQAELGPERAAAPTCNGLPLTAEGSPNGTVIGTAGDDVILTRGATRVDAGAGNDSICVTGKGTAVINAGPGDDFVGARAHKGKSFVSLGFGDDAFYGGDGNDRVWSQEASNQTSPDDSDLIDAGGGDDYVISGSSTALNTDVVALGPGDDALVTYGSSGGASLSGGLGINTYQPLPGRDGERRLGLRQRDRAGVQGRRRPDRVVVVPAFRPDRAARPERPFPGQQGARVGGGRRHVPRRAARPGRRRPPHGRPRRVQQPPRRGRAVDRRAGERPAQGGRAATTC